MKVYLSGPIGGMPDGNLGAFVNAEMHWAENLGYDVVNPRDFMENEGKVWEECLRFDLTKMLECDAIAMLPGWEKSPGATLEHLVAWKLGFSVFDVQGEPLKDDPIFMSGIKSGSILTEAHNLVHGARGTVYGHPLDDYTKTAKIWSGILGVEVTPEQAILCMIGVKLSRLVNSPGHRDSALDVAGYAECLDLVRQERKNRA